MSPDRKKKVQGKPLEYDFHGLTAEEAGRRLHRILDLHSGRAGLEIAIVHGKGSGILALEVERFARKDPRVLSFQRGFFNEGVTTLVLSGKTVPARESAAPNAEKWEGLPAPPVRRRKR